MAWLGDLAGLVAWPGDRGDLVAWLGDLGDLLAWLGDRGGLVAWPGDLGGRLAWRPIRGCGAALRGCGPLAAVSHVLLRFPERGAGYGRGPARVPGCGRPQRWVRRR